MAVYAIGDVQGCCDELQRLLERIAFDPARDRLWFAGDLVNRGPRSADVLRLVRDLGEAALTVLGNHDLHLLAVVRGFRKYHRKDSFADVMAAKDRDALLDWLRTRPLLHHDAGLGITLVHAGLPPQWDIVTAQSCAREVEAALAGPQLDDFLAHMYGNEPDRWRDDLEGWERLRFSVNCLTRMRYCDEDGRLALEEKGAPGTQPKKLKPWFAWKHRLSRDATVAFGHWSTLGFLREQGVIALDTGCLWGGKLTALRLDADAEPVQVKCDLKREPGED